MELGRHWAARVSGGYSLPRISAFRRTELPLTAFFDRVAGPLLLISSLLLISRMFEVDFTREYVVLAVLTFLTSSLVFGELNVFRWWQQGSVIRSARHVLVGWVIVFGILLFVGYATKSSDYYSRRVLLTWFLLAPLALFLGQALARAFVVRRGTRHARTAVIAGASELAVRFAQSLQTQGLIPTQIKAFFDDRKSNRLPPMSPQMLSGTLDNLPAYVNANGVQSVYIALPMAAQPRTLRLLDELKDTTASIYFIPDISIATLGRAHFDHVGEMPVIAACESPFTGANGMIKRVCDIVIALLVIILLHPLFIAIMIGVKLSSAGPVIFKQRRYGLDGREIVVYKFRTMSVCEDGDSIQQASRNDGRITRVGAFLRKTSFDELPQFINVLQGRMSVVGPRPHAVAHNEMYRKLIKGYMIRHKVRPGITGWAQINGCRGQTETVDKMRARVEYDLEYLRNWSPLLDLWIIARTAKLVCKDSTAY